MRHETGPAANCSSQSGLSESAEQPAERLRHVSASFGLSQRGEANEEVEE